MANLSAVISADTSKFVEEVKSARYMLDKFVKQSEQASNSIKDNSSATNEQVKAYSRVIQQLEKVASGTMNTKQQQAALSDQIRELKVQWQSLSDTAKNDDFGKSLSDTLKNTEAELDNLKSKLSSVGDVRPKGTLKKQLRETTQELTSLTAQYRAMSAAEKASASGRELASKMDELREKAGGLTDTIGDVQQEINTMASDTPNLDVFNDALGIGADLLSTYSSVLAKVTGDEESLKSAIATVMAVQSAANLMTKVTNALQSSSTIMLKTRAIQEGAAAVAIKLRTAAEGKGTIATKAATMAQAAFNLIARANPYVLLATAIIGVGAALIAFTRHLNESSEAEKKAQMEAEALKEREEHLKSQTDELSETSAKARVKFYELQEQWKSLKTEAEKKAWISDNQSAFNELGLSIYQVKTAEDIFVKNTDLVCDALLARAVAAKQAEQAANDLIELEKKRNNKSVESGDFYTVYKRGDKISDTEARQAGVRTQKERLGGSGAYATIEDLSGDEVKKVNQNREKQARKRKKQLSKKYDEEEKVIKDAYQKSIETVKKSEDKLRELGDKPKAKGNTSTSKPSKKDNVESHVKGSLSDLESQLSKLQNDYSDGLLPNLSKDGYKEEVEKLEKKIKEKRIELGLDAVVSEDSIAFIDGEISKKNKELNLAINNESRKKIQDEIDILVGKKEEIKLYLKAVVDKKDVEDIIKSVSEHKEGDNDKPKQFGMSNVERAQSNADSLKEEMDFWQSIVDRCKEEYDLTKKRISLGATLTVDENNLVSIYDEAIEKVKELSSEYKKASKSASELQASAELKNKKWEGLKEGINTFRNLEGATSNIGNAWKSLGEQWKDMSAFEQLTSAFDATISTIDNVIKAYESVNEIIKLFGEISELSAAKKVAANSAEMASDTAKAGLETANTQTKIANDSAESASEIGKLGVKEASAIASATASGAALPFPANLAAIAAGIAAVVAGFAMVFSCFADGGIVGGNSTIGDYNIARVNKGEMILNGTQQKRLFNLLDGTSNRNGTIIGQGGNVQFRIKGNNLYGVLRNHTQKGNKIGR